MPFEIQGSTCSSKDFRMYSGDATAAKQDLERLQGYLTDRVAKGKTGVLSLVVKNSQVTFERKSWYQFWARTDQKMQDTANYLNSIIEKAYTGEAENPLLNEAKENFSSYLEKKKNRIGTESLARCLTTFRSAETPISKEVEGGTSLSTEVGKLSASAGQSKALPTEIRNIHHLDHFLKEELGVTQEETPIGTGNFGKVYAVTVAGDSTSYVYKIPKALETAENLVHMAAATEVQDWTKHGDIAASQVKKIQAMTQTKFFIIAHTPDATFYQRDFYYVPADEVGNLKEKLLTNSPNTEVLIAGQLMTKASGQEVEQLLTQGTDFSPGTKNFTNVACGLFGFLEQAHDADFVHRDIAPKNLMFNEKTGELKIIDFGTSEKLEGKKSQRMTGSPQYMAPSVKQGKEYGSEVDFFSSAMTLLTLINPEEFKKFADARQDALKKESTDEILLRSRDANKSLLDIYLKTIADESGSSATAKALEANPKVKELIELAFEVSEGGETGAAAFPKWQAAFNSFGGFGKGTSLADVGAKVDLFLEKERTSRESTGSFSSEGFEER